MLQGAPTDSGRKRNPAAPADDDTDVAVCRRMSWCSHAAVRWPGRYQRTPGAARNPGRRPITRSSSTKERRRPPAAPQNAAPPAGAGRAGCGSRSPAHRSPRARAWRSERSHQAMGCARSSGGASESAPYLASRRPEPRGAVDRTSRWPIPTGKKNKRRCRQSSFAAALRARARVTKAVNAADFL